MLSKKLLVSVLAVVLSILSVVPVFAEGEQGSVTLQTSETIFCVTVPTVLPLWIDASGNITTPDYLEIRNERHFPVVVYSIEGVADTGVKAAMFSSRAGVKVNGYTAYQWYITKAKPWVKKANTYMEIPIICTIGM